MNQNQTMLQGFEWDLVPDGHHWTRLSKEARHLSHLGFTSIWLPPAGKASNGSTDVGYAIYDPYDLGEFDQKGSIRTKYGTAKEYKEAVRKLRTLGIAPLADMVMNHRMGADASETVVCREVNTENRNEVSETAVSKELYTRFTYPGRKGKYSKATLDHTCFTGADYFDDTGYHLYLLDGKTYASDVDHEKGNFDYLMGLDLDVLNPDVKKELIRLGLFYIKKVGISGFRLDAVKHISAQFMREWIQALRGATDKELFTVGEYWSYNLDSLNWYIGETQGEIALFDVPLHQRFFDISRDNDGNYDMGAMFNNTLVACNEPLAVTFVDNHDTQPGQALQSFVEAWFKPIAYAVVLLRGRGLPCVFWADLYGHATGAFKPVRDLPLLLKVRKHLAYGDLYDYFDHDSIVGFTRGGIKEKRNSGLAFLCSNRGDGEKRMYVGNQWAGKTFLCLRGGFKSVKIDSEGCGIFHVSHRNYSLYAPLSLRSLFARFFS